MNHILMMILVSFAAQASFAFSEVTCEYLGGDSRELTFQNLYLNVAELAKSDVVISTSLSKEVFSEVECATEENPDHILYCQNENFGLVLALDEQPMQAVVNPYIVNGEQYGPLYFSCEAE